MRVEFTPFLISKVILRGMLQHFLDLVFRKQEMQFRLCAKLGSGVGGIQNSKVVVVVVVVVAQIKLMMFGVSHEASKRWLRRFWILALPAEPTKKCKWVCIGLGPCTHYLWGRPSPCWYSDSGEPTSAHQALSLSPAKPHSIR